MIAGIFDRLFKKKKDESDYEEVEYQDEVASVEGMGVYDHIRTPFQEVPSELDMDAIISYKFDGLEYRLKIQNKSIDMIGNIKVYLRSDKKSVASVIDSKQEVEMLEPGKAVKIRLRLKPKYKIGKSGIYGKVEYFDFKSKEKKVVRLPQANVDLELKDIKFKKINEDKWRQISSGLNALEIETEKMDIPPDKAFNIFKNTLNNMGFFMLPPVENRNLYRGIVRFYGYDDEENQYVIETQVIGDTQSSKVLFRIWSEDAQGAMSVAYKTLDVIEGPLKIKKFIVET